MINDATIVRIEKPFFDETSLTFTGIGVPIGGSQGQVLSKATNSNYDTTWADPSIGVPAGGSEGQFLVKSSNNNYDTEWKDLSALQGSEYLLQTVYNDSGSTIIRGEVVYFADGYLSYPLVSRALANTVHDSAVIGLAVDNILNDDYGSIVVNGLLDGVNTNNFNPGDKLYLSTSVSGGITNVRPVAPNHAILIGFCVKKGLNDGVIYVNINPGTHLEWLHDVKLESLSNRDFLYFSESGFWINKKLDISDVSGSLSSGDLSGYYPIDNPSGFITGVENVVYTTGDQNISGNKNFLDSVSIGDQLEISTLYVGSDNKVGINNENPSGALDVSGASYFSERPLINGSGVLLIGELTTEDINALNLSNSSYVIAIPGDNLIEKYAEAKALTPNSQAKSETNRASLIILPGEYSVSQELVIDTSFVDIIGLGAQVKNPSVTILNNTISVTANDVRVSGISVGNQQFKIADSKPLQYFENCSGGDNSFSSQNPYNFQASGTFVNCTGGDVSFAGFRIASGTFINCSGGYASFGGDGGYASGIFENCVGGDYSFGGGYGANAIGKFTKCSGGTYSFGGQFGTANGTFTDCTGGEYSFAGEGGIASGTFNRCKGDFYSFGSYGVASGSFSNCSGESYTFAGEGGTASGTFLNCTGSYRSFGGAGTASGTFINCITRQDESFGYYASGTFIGCIAAFYSFGTGGTATGIFRDCIGEDYCFGTGLGFEGTASGTFINCKGGYRSWEYCVCSGTFVNCISGDESFKGTASGFFQGCRAGNSSFGASGGVASGIFIGCIGGLASFGSASGGEASGIFKSCSGGDGSFGGYEIFSGSGTASGTFSDCTGGDKSFGGEGGVVNGVFENCSSGNYSFGSGEFSSGTVTGTLFNCRTSGEFIELTPPSSGKAIMVNCLDGNGDVVEGEAEAL